MIRSGCEIFVARRGWWQPRAGRPNCPRGDARYARVSSRVCEAFVMHLRHWARCPLILPYVSYRIFQVRMWVFEEMVQVRAFSSF